jgi:TetR/AcrR family transcriptional regulator, repressor of fatR-cypB operon
MVVGLN